MRSMRAFCTVLVNILGKFNGQLRRSCSTSFVDVAASDKTCGQCSVKAKGFSHEAGRNKEAKSRMALVVFEQKVLLVKWVRW
jgi:hypothetical protein